jgi:bacteriorhodopsin
VNVPYEYLVNVPEYWENYRGCARCGQSVQDEGAITEEDFRRRRIRKYLYLFAVAPGSIVAAIFTFLLFAFKVGADSLFLFLLKLRSFNFSENFVFIGFFVFLTFVWVWMCCALILKEDRDLAKRSGNVKVAIFWNVFNLALVAAFVFLLVEAATLLEKEQAAGNRTSEPVHRRRVGGGRR